MLEYGGMKSNSNLNDARGSFLADNFLAQGMESYCVRAFAEALEVIPYTLAENAGLNPIQIVTELRNRHAGGEAAAGINVRRNAVSNMLEENVVQPLLVTTSAINLATECVRMILKVRQSIQPVLTQPWAIAGIAASPSDLANHPDAYHNCMENVWQGLSSTDNWRVFFQWASMNVEGRMLTLAVCSQIDDIVPTR